MTDKLNKDIIDAVKGCMQSAHSDGKYGMEESAATGLLFQMLMEKLQSLPMVSGEPVAWMRNTEAETHGNAFIPQIHRSAWIEELPNGGVERLYSIPLYTSPQALTPITADDVTDETVKEIFPTSATAFSRKSGTYKKITRDIANIYNAVIKHKHRSEA